MLNKILNIFNKEKIMDDIKVDQEVIIEETPVQEIKEEVKKEKPKKEEVKKEVEEIKYPKPRHFPDCTCFKCYKWKNQSAK